MSVVAAEAVVMLGTSKVAVMDQRVSRVALTLGVVAFCTVACLVAFFVVGGWFGAINDVGNALLGLLTAVLAVMLRRGGSGVIPTALAVLGAAVTVVGSVLIVFDVTGFLLSGLVSGLGFALLGIWLITINRSAPAGRPWPGRLRTLGVVAGATMAVGMVNIAGIAMGVDDYETAPPWVFAGFLGWLGIYLLLPIWSICLGRVLARRSDR